MKKLFLLLSIILMIPYFATAQTYSWQVINPTSISGTPDFSDVFFTAADTGWITSSSQTNIYKTVGGAASFTTQTTPLGATSAIHMLDADNGYSGGQGGWVYKTTDGGLNWNMLASMGTLFDISFPPETNPSNPAGYACGNSGNVWKITATLTNLNTGLNGDFNGISSPSVNHVWVCGGNRIYYYNGTNFTSQFAPTGTFNDIHFINNQEGWVVGDFGVIGHTENGGSLWVTQVNPDIQNRSLSCVFFLDSEYGWAVGNGGIIMSTVDGGTTWVIEADGLTSNYLLGVFFTSPTNGYVAGNNKTLLKYSELSGIDDKLTLVAFEVHPNPVKDKLKIKCTDFKTENGIIEILSLDGHLLIRKEATKGIANREIDMSKLVSGMYLCKTSIGNRNSTKKIIKE